MEFIYGESHYKCTTLEERSFAVDCFDISIVQGVWKFGTEVCVIYLFMIVLDYELYIAKVQRASRCPGCWFGTKLNRRTMWQILKSPSLQMKTKSFEFKCPIYNFICEFVCSIYNPIQYVVGSRRKNVSFYLDLEFR